MKNLTSHELHGAIGQALAEVSRRLVSGELDESGRYYSDEGLRLVRRWAGSGLPRSRQRQPRLSRKAASRRFPVESVTMGQRRNPDGTDACDAG